MEVGCRQSRSGRKPFDLLSNGGHFLFSRVKAEAQASRERVRGPRGVISRPRSPRGLLPRNGRRGPCGRWNLPEHFSHGKPGKQPPKERGRALARAAQLGIEEQQRGRVSGPCERERPGTRAHAEWTRAFEVPGQAAPFLGRKWSPSEGRHRWRCQWPRRGPGWASRCAPQGVSILAQGSGGRGAVHCRLPKALGGA
uniref:Uncharacterized protein n=1 Tax=Myotis myotis TaxID=51298 RepID=A0A7J7Z5J9_MYOMY|nr:hypothetical protein mMyoMyo1_010793 [Myotis myotis]